MSHEQQLDGDAPDAAAAALMVRERRLDAKRKRVRMLGALLRDLDMAVYMELLALYHLDCSFFWLAAKALIHASLLTPAPDAQLDRPPDEPKPFLPLLLFAFVANFALHLLSAAPRAGEETREYLHGGLLIDFIGQQGPSPKWKLAGLDVCILALQLLMVAIHVKRRELKKVLAAASTTTTTTTDATPTTTANDTTAPSQPSASAPRGQDADDEERGQLHRSDTLSDFAADDGDDDDDDDNDDQDRDALLPTSDSGYTDALDLLTSGHCIVADVSLVDTLFAEHANYTAFRQSDGAMGGDMPATLRRLNTLRTRLGVGGG
jgi:hypothetical protein